MVSSIPDILLAFCAAFGIRIPPTAKLERFLFPRAILAPGWRHLCDNLLQRGLNSCRFWPHFLEVLKALLNFLRDHMLDIVTDLKQAQRPEVAALLESRSYVTFAHWRWHTLDNVCQAIDGILDTLRENFIFMKICF